MVLFRCTALFLLSVTWSVGQSLRSHNDDFIKQLYQDPGYLSRKEQIVKEFAHAVPGSWGEFVKGVDEDLVTSKKLIALTFDACGGPHGSGIQHRAGM